MQPRPCPCRERSGGRHEFWGSAAAPRAASAQNAGTSNKGKTQGNETIKHGNAKGNPNGKQKGAQP